MTVTGRVSRAARLLGRGDVLEGYAHDLRPIEINTQQQFSEMHDGTEYPWVDVFYIVAGQHRDKTTVVGTVKEVISHDYKVFAA